MRTFTRNEYMYLETLRKRNSKLFSEGPMEKIREPLNKPMTVEERKLRSNIRKRCRRYLFELALAEYCGLTPDRVMLRAGINNVVDGINNAFDLLVQKGLEKKVESEKEI